MLIGAVGCNSADTSEPATDAPATDSPTDKPTEVPTDKPTDKPTEKPTEKPTDEPLELEEMFYYFPENAFLFKKYGRMQETDEGLRCDPAAAGLEFSGIMKGEVILELEVDRNTYFTVFVDGERIDERFRVTPDDKQITLVDFGEEQGEHNVRVLKQTEAKRSLCTITAVTLTGILEEAPADKQFYIEFIGDSITSGTGIFGNSTTGGIDGTELQDATSNYAFQTAEALGADFSLVSCSSIGICSGWNSYIEKQYYPCASYFRDTEEKYDFERVPDLVVINLGTNDQTKGCKDKDFKERVEELVNLVRDSYGEKVEILWIYDMMNYGKQDLVLATLDEMGGELMGLYTLKVKRDNNGGTSHPDLKAHGIVAQQLIEFIEDNYLLY
jgi:hypothetical protein